MKNLDAALKRTSAFSTQKILVVTRSPQDWGENPSRSCNCDSRENISACLRQGPNQKGFLQPLLRRQHL